MPFLGFEMVGMPAHDARRPFWYVTAAKQTHITVFLLGAVQFGNQSYKESIHQSGWAQVKKQHRAAILGY